MCLKQRDYAYELQRLGKMSLRLLLDISLGPLSTNTTMQMRWTFTVQAFLVLPWPHNYNSAMCLMLLSTSPLLKFSG
jgi:hypothetical protein